MASKVPLWDLAFLNLNPNPYPKIPPELFFLGGRGLVFKISNSPWYRAHFQKDLGLLMFSNTVLTNPNFLRSRSIYLSALLVCLKTHYLLAIHGQFDAFAGQKLELLQSSFA